MKRRILTIGLTQVLARQLQYEFHQRGIYVEGTTSGRYGLTAASDYSPDMIILGSNLYDMQYTSVYEQLKCQPQTRELPVVMLTNPNNGHSSTNGFVLQPGDYQFPTSAFVLYAVVDLLRSMQII